MGCKGCIEFLLKLLNFLLLLGGLAMVGYGVYLFVEFKNATSPSEDPVIPPLTNELIKLGRPMLMAMSSSSTIFDNLPKAWFIYLFIGVGAFLILVSFFGCIGTCTGNGCCLSCYSFLVILLILVELGCASFIFFKESWREEIPSDKTGNFDMIYDFLEDHWEIIKWVALGIVIFEGLVFLLALGVRAANRPDEYDSDDEYTLPRQQIRQPLINASPAPATGVPVGGTIESRPSRNDAWSARMREKYGLDTTEFTYNPSGSNRYPESAVAPSEEKGRCTIM